MANKVDEMLAQARIDENPWSPDEVIELMKKPKPIIPFPKKSKDTIVPLIPPPGDNYQPPPTVVEATSSEASRFIFPELKPFPDARTFTLPRIVNGLLEDIRLVYLPELKTIPGNIF